MNATRRQFFGSTFRTAALLSIAPRVPPFLCRAAAALDPERAGGGPTALVVVQLSGGNDGLNCVAPYSDDIYARSRPTLRLGAGEVLKIDDRVGLHPAMRACRRLYDERAFSIIQGVGYPDSSREHPEAERAWQSARPDDAAHPTGWAGQYADDAIAGGRIAVPVAFVDVTRPPFAVRSASALVPVVRAAEDLARRALPGENEEEARLLTTAGEAGNPLLDHVRAASAAAFEMSRRVRRALAVTALARYPATQFAQRLQAIACLVRADVGIRIYYTVLGGDGFGGFDNHAIQKENHAALLAQFSEAIGAFIDDLRRDRLADRVTLMTVSEFGRTVSENGRRGTGHGAAAPVFLAGGRLKGGLIGEHPDLRNLDNDALRHHIDFRRIYATMLGPWLGADADGILGTHFDPVACLA